MVTIYGNFKRKMLMKVLWSKDHYEDNAPKKKKIKRQ